MSETPEKIEIFRGLKGVYFDRSRVCYIDGRAGELRYRGAPSPIPADEPSFSGRRLGTGLPRRS